MSTDLPPLPAGFKGRNSALADVEMAARMGIEYALATTGSSDLDADSLRNTWQSPGFDPTQDVYFVFGPEGKPAGYIEVWANQTPPVHPFIWGIVPQDFQGLGIGSHILAWGERRAHAVLDRVDDGLRVAPYASTAPQIEAAKSLLQDNGWSHIRSYYTMGIDFAGPPPEPVFPAGISLRTFRPEDAQVVYRAMDESFSDHFGHVEQPFETAFERFRHDAIDDPLFDPELWFLALDGEALAGICLCRSKSPDDPDSGFVRILGVRRPWRKRGLGLALLRQAFCEFHRRGYARVDLGVDASNMTGALRLYENAGMRVLRQMDMYEKELRPGRELRVQEIEE
jgi:mycothiol synthase